jgi:acetylornithine deacetylase
MPHNFVNPFFLAQEALREILDRWHKEFPPHEQEKAYFYSAPSSMKPTRWSSPDGAFNMIPPQVTIMGDIRLTPFYTMTDAMAAVDKYVAEINSRIESLYTPAPCYKNVHADGTHGKIQFEWVGEAYKGIACKIDGVGYKALSAATKEVIGECKPFSLTGSLPLVADLQDAGYDLQIAGYGAEVAYHAPNEYCTLSGMKSGGAILAKVIYKVNQSISSSS